MNNILAQIKDCLSITDTAQDSVLLLSIKKTLWILECINGCSMLAQDDNGVDIIHSEWIPWCYLSNCKISLCVPYITSVISIDGKDPAWYRIVWASKNCIELDKSNTCDCTCTTCKSIEIIYKWWITRLNSCLLQLFLHMYQTDKAKCNGQTIKKIQQLDQTIEYCCDIDSQLFISNIKKIQTMYQKYQTLYYCCH